MTDIAYFKAHEGALSAHCEFVTLLISQLQRTASLTGHIPAKRGPLDISFGPFISPYTGSAYGDLIFLLLGSYPTVLGARSPYDIF